MQRFPRQKDATRLNSIIRHRHRIAFIYGPVTGLATAVLSLCYSSVHRATAFWKPKGLGSLALLGRGIVVNALDNQKVGPSEQNPALHFLGIVSFVTNMLGDRIKVNASQWECLHTAGEFTGVVLGHCSRITKL